ncbi:MAG TPA: RNA polymerase sigma factor [Polyangia bacterium]
MAEDPNTLAAALLEEVGWVRELAAQLVGPGAADDVAQDAWMAATRSKPTTGEPLRPWLGVVVRKLAHTRKRSEARRRGHESAAAPPAVDLATPEALLARAELLRLVSELVTSLDEPHRATILLRYYEGLTSLQIAERLGVPDGTVRWRLKQALEELRRLLDRRVQGGRRAWMVALGATSAPTKAAIAAKLGSTAALKILGALSLAALGSVIAMRAAHHSRRPLAMAVESQPAASGAASPRSGAPSLEDAQRAYVQGRYDEAIQLAGRAKASEPARAWRVIGASSCFKGDAAEAGAAWTHLDATGRKFIEYVCGRNHVVVPKDAEGRKVL